MNSFLRFSRAVRCAEACGARNGLMVFFTALALASLLAAQPAATTVWHGALHTAAGAPIAGAHVRLSSGRTSAEAVTSANGSFQLAPLPAGSYRLSVSATGNSAEFAQPIELGSVASPVVLTLSTRGELTVAEQKEKAQSATGGEQLSSQAVSSSPLGDASW